MLPAIPCTAERREVTITTQGLTEIYSRGTVWIRANDPSAGSPTETLLLLLLPLSDKVYEIFRTSSETTRGAVQIIHRITQSVGATGGVYKGQGRNQHKLMTCAY